MTALYRKEMHQNFTSLPTYIFVAFLAAAGGFYFTIFNLRGLWPTFEDALISISYIFLLTVPLLTMRTVTAERTDRTDKLLFALPVSTSSIVLAKYLSLLTILSIPTAILALFPLILTFFGTVNLTTSYIALLGFVLFAATLLALGLFISSLTDNTTSAAIVCFGVLLIFYFINPIIGLMPITAGVNLIVLSTLAAGLGLGLFHFLGSIKAALAIYGLLQASLVALFFITPNFIELSLVRVLSAVDLVQRMSSFTHGLLDLTAIVYYMGAIVLLLLFTAISLNTTRGRQ